MSRLNSVYLELGFRITGWTSALWMLLNGLYITLVPHRLVTDSWRWMDYIPGHGYTVGGGFILGALLTALCLLRKDLLWGAVVTGVAGILLLFMAFASSISGFTGHTGGLGGFSYALIAALQLVQAQVLLVSRRE